MFLIHTADWHITSGKAYIPNATERALQAIRAIYSLAKERGIDTVVVAGDVFDTAAITQADRRALAEVVLTNDEAGISTLMIPGNHDDRKSANTTLDYLAQLTKHERFKHSYVVEKTRLVIRHGYGFLLFTGEPWSKLNDHIATISTGSMELGLKGLIVVAHATIKGAMTTTKFVMEHGDVLTQPHSFVTYYALGDIHLRQAVCDRGYYCGSPYQVNFGEPGPNGVLVVDTDNPDDPEFVEIPSIKLVTISKPEDKIPENSYARIMYDEKPLTDVELPVNVIKTQWAGAEVDLSAVNITGDSLFSGLEDILKQRGLTASNDIELAMQELKEARIAVGE